MARSSVTRGRAPLVAAALAGGLLVGFAVAFHLDEESRRRLRKAFFELQELPFRVLV